MVALVHSPELQRVATIGADRERGGFQHDGVVSKEHNLLTTIPDWEYKNAVTGVGIKWRLYLNKSGAILRLSDRVKSLASLDFACSVEKQVCGAFALPFGNWRAVIGQ